MALYDSADCLSRMKTGLNRPTTDEAWGTSDATAYAVLTEAQQELYQYAVTRAPAAFIGAPTALTPSSDRKTWTFGADADGADVWPMGQATIYPSLASYPDYPWIEGLDYLLEGDLIRIPNDRSWSGTLYASFSGTPNVLSASAAPTLPKPLRPAMIALAKAKFAEQVLKADPTPYLAEYESLLVNALVMLRTQVRTQGTRQSFRRDWTRSSDFGSHGGG